MQAWRGKSTTLTSIQAPGCSLTCRALELGRRAVDEGTRLPRLRLRPPAVAELGAQRQEPALWDGLGGSQPGNEAHGLETRPAGAGSSREREIQMQISLLNTPD